MQAAAVCAIIHRITKIPQLVAVLRYYSDIRKCIRISIFFDNIGGADGGVRYGFYRGRNATTSVSSTVHGVSLFFSLYCLYLRALVSGKVKN